MTVRHRLRRLLDRANACGLDQPPGCPACRERRGQIVYATSQRLADETVVPVADHPAPCPACGQVAEFVIEAVRPFVADAPADDGGGVMTFDPRTGTFV